MSKKTNPAWRGGARQKVSFWSNGSADLGGAFLFLGEAS
jgi:hypothetical protein